MIHSKKFVCSYKYLGRTWSIHIDAKDHEEAVDRAKRLGSLEVLGELGGEIPANIPGALWLVRGVVWFRNLFISSTNVRGMARRWEALI